VRAAQAATLRRANMGTLAACTTSTSRRTGRGAARATLAVAPVCAAAVAGFRVSSLTTPGGIRRCLHRITSPRSSGSFQLEVGLLMAFSRRSSGSHESPSRTELQRACTTRQKVGVERHWAVPSHQTA
jgi:hypothetical protein